MQDLFYRGISFQILRRGKNGYRWSVGHIDSNRLSAGETAGQGAFRLAVTEAHQAIDTWLLTIQLTLDRQG